MSRTASYLNFGIGFCKVSSNDHELVSSVSRLFDAANLLEEGDPVAEIDFDEFHELIGATPSELDEDNFGCILYLLKDRAFHMYEHALWLDAAALSCPEDHGPVLIVGKSQSGKSTITTALTLSGKFKIISEDVVFIDEQATILSVPLPLSLRPGTVERVSAAGVGSMDLVNEEWFFHRDSYELSGVNTSFSAIYLLQGVNPEDPGPLSMRSVTYSDVLKEILPISNFLKKSWAMDVFAQLAQNAKCFSMAGGNVKSRLDAIMETSK